ncbi:MAG: GMP synthase [bacterium]
MSSTTINIAVIDLYNNEVNQGMRCIKDLLHEFDCRYKNISVQYKVYDARYKDEIPSDKYDVYISSGGPGSPFEGEGSAWEKKYFELIDKIWNHNQKNSTGKKYIFFICHSFQLMARHFKFGEVTKRNSKSFGVMPVHKTEDGLNESILKGLPVPFYGADFRDFQVVQPNKKVIDEFGARIIALEKIRPHIALERAIMGVRISNEIVGTQFHPEADPASMYYHFRQPERKEHVVSNYGEEKYFEMLRLLEEPMSIPLTRKTVIPNFLTNAIKELRPEESSE